MQHPSRSSTTGVIRCRSSPYSHRGQQRLCSLYQRLVYRWLTYSRRVAQLVGLKTPQRRGATSSSMSSSSRDVWKTLKSTALEFGGVESKFSKSSDRKMKWWGYWSRVYSKEVVNRKYRDGMTIWITRGAVSPLYFWSFGVGEGERYLVDLTQHYLNW